MFYKFDDFGRYDGQSVTAIERSTSVVPGGFTPDWNFNGVIWKYAPGVSTGSVLQPAAQEAPAPEYTWFIDIGPFFDRFGAAKLAVLASANATVKALVTDLQVRKWVDLARPDVGQGIDALIAIGISGVDATLKAAILTTPVAPEENMALRRLYFE